MSYAAIEEDAHDAGLMVMGGLHPRRVRSPEDDVGTLILLGTGPGFWPVFTTSEEYGDGQPDPVDRWSKRVIGGLATRFEAECRFPSDGPPYAPFIAWAMASGRFAQSPVGMMVHDRVGMMISLRGALLFAHEMPLPETPPFDPCTACAAPCADACPVGALSALRPYDVDNCHGFLNGAGAQSCMMDGCAARLACPLSRGAERHPDQSALHMRAFHPS